MGNVPSGSEDNSNTVATSTGPSHSHNNHRSSTSNNNRDENRKSQQQQRRSKSSSSSSKHQQKESETTKGNDTTNMNEPITIRATKVVNEIHNNIVNGIRKLQEETNNNSSSNSNSNSNNDHNNPAASLLDSMCGPYLKGSGNGVRSSYSEEMYSYEEDDYEEEEEEDSRTISEEETTVTNDYRSNNKGGGRSSNTKGRHSNHNQDETTTVDSRSSYISEDDHHPTDRNNKNKSSSLNSSNKKNHKKGHRGTSRRKDESSYEETEDDYDEEEDDTYTAQSSRVTSAEDDDDDDDDDDNEDDDEETAISKKKSRGHKSSHTTPLATTSATAGTGAAVTTLGLSSLHKQPLASSFAKRCYFTKAGIGSHTQHYEGLTLKSNNVIFMLASAMKLKGCPTICDEDLRRVEMTYPNQFSRLPDELLLSSGWRRISKYCHFSNKPIPDGIPFFHSRQRLHPSGGYYFLLASAVGMVRPIDVEPLTRDTLVLLETDYPSQCDSAPSCLIQDPDEWTVVDKFCFFSGGPINTDEDVYYMADFDGNPIYMLAFLSPSLTPAELYKLDHHFDTVDADGNPITNNEPLRSIAAVEEVESVYDLTIRDFNDLQLYHLGPCRALPYYILQPTAWVKILPPHFIEARTIALQRATEYEIQQHGRVISTNTNRINNNLNLATKMPLPPPQSYLVDEDPSFYPDYNDHNTTTAMMMAENDVGMMQYQQQQQQMLSDHPLYRTQQQQHYDAMYSPSLMMQQQQQKQDHAYLRNIAEEGAFTTTVDNNAVPIDEAISGGYRHQFTGSRSSNGFLPPHISSMGSNNQNGNGGIDPPEDEPPSLRKRGAVGGGIMMGPQQYHQQHQNVGVYGNSQRSVSSTDDPSYNMNSPSSYNDGENQQESMSPHHNGPHIDDDDDYISNVDDPISPPYQPTPSDFDDEYNNNNEEYEDNIDMNDHHRYHQTNNVTANTAQQFHYNNINDDDKYNDIDDEFIANNNINDKEQSPDEEAYRISNDQFDEQNDGTFNTNLFTGNNTNYENDNAYYNDNNDEFADITPQPSNDEPFHDPRRDYLHDHDDNELVYDDHGFPVNRQIPATSGTTESEFSAPNFNAIDNNDDGFSNGLLYMSTSTDENIQAPLQTTKRGNTSSQLQAQQHQLHDINNIDDNDDDISPKPVQRHFPPISPRSGHGSEYSQSSALRGAQELLRRNRQKRLELAMRMKQQVRQYKDDEAGDDHDDINNDIPVDENYHMATHRGTTTNDVISPQSQDSGSTWQTGVSEYTGSEVTGGGSSIWTETENMNHPDRSSRRALILQMARARMKNHGGGNSNNKNGLALEEKKLEHVQENASEMDLPVDLD